MIPIVLKKEVETLARKQGISLGEFIRKSLTDRLQTIKNPQKTDKDALFGLKVYRGTAPKNLSTHHDEYLYGEET